VPWTSRAVVFPRRRPSRGRGDVAILIVGDQAGLLGRGTGGGVRPGRLRSAGCAARAGAGAAGDRSPPWCLCSFAGRSYALFWGLERCAAVGQGFVPGEKSAAAIAAVISGRVNSSGRLPVTLPRSAGAQPCSCLHPPLGGPSTVGNLPTAPACPSGVDRHIRRSSTRTWSSEATSRRGGGFVANVARD
jgi:beta-glucosidase